MNLEEMPKNDPKASKKLDDELRKDQLENLRQKTASTDGEHDEGASFEKLKQDWQDFYRKIFGIEADFSKINIPEKQEGLNLLLIMEERRSAQKLFDKCRELFPVFKYKEGDLSVVSDRDTTKGSYAIWVKGVQEVDKELGSLPTDDMRRGEINNETLEERLLHEIKYFTETGEHLDLKSATICAGSYDVERPNFIPYVEFREQMSVCLAYNSRHGVNVGLFGFRRVGS